MLKNFIKRFLLIVFGILLSLVVLELSMRLAGFLISNYQNHKNVKVLKKKSKYTVMCIGESTTAGQYPIQLQEILDKKYPNKFSVIDCGMSGASLNIIIKTLDEIIDKNNPNIAICMIGNNISNFQDDSFVQKIKIYRLFKQYIKKYQNISINKIYDTIQLQNNITKCEPILQNAVKLFYQAKYHKATQIFQYILQNNPNDEIAYFFLTEIAYSSGKQSTAIQMAEKAILSDFKFMRISYYIKVILYYSNIDDLKTTNFINQICNEKLLFINPNLYKLITIFIKKNKKESIIEFFNNFYSPDIYNSFLAIESFKNKDYSKANDYFEKAEKFRLANPDKETCILYKQIVKKIIRNNTKVICMQYPVRSVNSLKNILKDEPYYDKITFISNEQNFKKALMEKQYDDIFIDQCAGDFGHCTDLGNTMIAENVANTLEKLVN